MIAAIHAAYSLHLVHGLLAGAERARGHAWGSADTAVQSWRWARAGGACEHGCQPRHQPEVIRALLWEDCPMHHNQR